MCYEAVLKIRTTKYSEWGDRWKAYVLDLARDGVIPDDVVGEGSAP